MKTFYSEYAQHAMKFYINYPNLTEFRSEMDRENWEACRDALKVFDEHDKELILSIYGRKEIISVAVRQTGAQFGVSEFVLWKLVKDFEHGFAKRRGLI